MLGSILLGFVAGFFAGNGLPYFITGSFAQEHQFLLGKSAYTNILAGVVAFAIAALSWHFADLKDHRMAVCASAFLGVVAVGLIHARVWQVNRGLFRKSKAKDR